MCRALLAVSQTLSPSNGAQSNRASLRQGYGVQAVSAFRLRGGDGAPPSNIIVAPLAAKGAQAGRFILHSDPGKAGSGFVR